MGTAIAQWICLRLPSGGPRFKSQVLHLRFVHLKYIVLKHENKQKGWIWPVFRNKWFQSMRAAKDYVIKWPL